MIVGAVIVSYNPDVTVLQQNINAIVNQVNKIVVVDNGSKRISEIEKIILSNNKVHIIKNDRNKGIACALNQGMQYFYDQFYEWVLTLDQDSIMPAHIIESLSRYIGNQVGIICPQVNYLGWDQSPKLENSYSQIDACMTSGSLTSIKAWHTVHGFDEELFIDYVDNDFCKKLELNRYQIIRDNSTCFDHALGDSKYIILFGKKILYSKHSPQRSYYIIRNILIFNKRYKKHLNYCHESLKAIFLFLNSLFFCPPRLKTLKYLTEGIIDYHLGVCGPYDNRNDKEKKKK